MLSGFQANAAQDDANARLLATLRPTVGSPPPGVDPRVRRVTLSSAALGVRKSLYVYLPPDYRRPGVRYPVLYLLRGHEREWVNPAEDRTRQGTVVDVYLRLLAGGSVGPMILVFPGLTSDDGRVHSAATDFRARALAPDVPGLGPGRFETYLVHEVVPLVDALFPTLAGGRHRGVDGFSLGGFMALKVVTKYPALFSTAGAYDGTFLYANAHGTRIRDDDRVFRARLFDPIFGRPRDHAYAAANNPANLLIHGPWPAGPTAPADLPIGLDARRAGGSYEAGGRVSPLSHRTPTEHLAALRTIRWFVQFGPRHLEPMGSNYFRGAYLRSLLEERRLRCQLPAVIPDGAHNWATADRHMAATLPLHWETLNAP